MLAFGDSITNAGGELQWGVALHSWALWTARGLGLPYTGYAVDGAEVSGVVGEQIPAFLARAATPEGPYDLGCLYIGANDVRSPDWDPTAFHSGFAAGLAFLTERCERVLTATVPLGLGRPRAGAEKVGQLNEIVRRGAADAGALVMDLSDFGARNHVMTDHVHPTAFGQVAIAQRALAVLAADGVAVRVNPSTLIAPQRSGVGAVRGDFAYAYSDLKHQLREAALAFSSARRSR